MFKYLFHLNTGFQQHTTTQRMHALATRRTNRQRTRQPQHHHETRRHKPTTHRPSRLLIQSCLPTLRGGKSRLRCRKLCNRSFQRSATQTSNRRLRRCHLTEHKHRRQRWVPQFRQHPTTRTRHHQRNPRYIQTTNRERLPTTLQTWRSLPHLQTTTLSCIRRGGLFRYVYCRRRRIAAVSDYTQRTNHIPPNHSTKSYDRVFSQSCPRTTTRYAKTFSS